MSRTTRTKKHPASAGRAAAASPDAPDRGAFIRPFNDRTLIAYYRELFEWHGYIRFLGLPHLKENPDVPISRMFVEPLLGKRRIHPDEPPDRWRDQALTVRDAFAEHPRLVLLGDPGSGKSTLVSWLTWLFSTPERSAWTEQFGPLVPLPMVLRDMRVAGRVESWEGLLAAFLEQPVAAALRDAKYDIDALACRGQALFLLDGIDELGSVEVREKLHKAVWEGYGRYPNSRWLLTSRVVGYEQVEFHREDLPKESMRQRLGNIGVSTAELEKTFLLASHPMTEKDIAELLYVAPFNDDQIDAFARNWFDLRETVVAKRKEAVRSLCEGIRRNPGTQRLARIPNLLTMMALIQRVRAELPEGRVRLYDMIAEAYLESIDKFRGFKHRDYTLNEKKRWLARVGFEMQLRRAQTVGEDDDAGEILVGADDVRDWILDAMRVGGKEADEKEITELIEFFARRSGLLLPRGEGRFAFMHLSLQEYFAACCLKEQIGVRGWPDGKRILEGARRDDLRAYANQQVWRETLVLLFELSADEPYASDDLAGDLFDEGFKRLRADVSDEPRLAQAGLLLGEIALDSYSGLSHALRAEARRAAWHWQLANQQKVGPPWGVPAILSLALSGLDARQEMRVWGAFDEVSRPIKTLTRLSLNGCTGVTDLQPIQKLPALEELHLSRCSGVTDLQPLQKLTALTILDLTDCTGVTDLQPLQELTALTILCLGGCTGVTDWSPLDKLKNTRIFGRPDERLTG